MTPINTVNSSLIEIGTTGSEHHSPYFPLTNVILAPTVDRFRQKVIQTGSTLPDITSPLKQRFNSLLELVNDMGARLPNITGTTTNLLYHVGHHVQQMGNTLPDITSPIRNRLPLNSPVPSQPISTINSQTTVNKRDRPKRASRRRRSSRSRSRY